MATKYSNTPNAWEVFNQRGWQPIRDESIIPSIKKLVDRKKHSTPLIDLEWEEWEYGKE